MSDGREETPRRSVTAAQLALGLSIISFTVALGLNVGLSLVLERSGAGALPGLTLVNGILLAAATATVSFVGRGVAARSLGISIALAAIVVTVAAVTGRAAPEWSAFVLYLVASVLGDLSAALFWSVANELYDARAAKKVFPRLSAAGTAGAALAGLVARGFGDVLGTSGLVSLWVTSLVVAAAWALRLAGVGRTTLPQAGGRKRDAERVRTSGEDSTLVRALAFGFVVVIAVTTVGRFLYSASLANVYGADGVAIAKLNGTLNTIASIATALVQLLLTPLLLGRWGIRVTMFVYPVALVIVLGLLAVNPSLAVAIAVFFVTSVVRRAIQGPVESVLPSGLLPAAASRTVLLLTAIGAPVGMLLGGACLMLGRSGATNAVVLVGLALAFVLAIAAVWRARAYRSALRLRLAKGGRDLRELLLGATVKARDVDALLVDELDAADTDLVARLRMLVRARREDAGGSKQPWTPHGPLAAIALARLAEAYRLHAALSRLPGDGDPGASALLKAAVEHRLADDVLVVILSLQAATGESDLDRVSRRVFDRDGRARSAALEILDAVCPPDLRGLLVPLVEQVGIDAAREKAARRFGAPNVDPVVDLLDVPDPWIHACTVYVLDAADVERHRSRIEKLESAPDPFVAVAIAHALARVGVEVNA